MNSTNTADPNVMERTLAREREARKQAEMLLEEKSRELFIANQELEKTYENLQQKQALLVHSEKMASIGQLAAGVAHEINNPIGFVMSNVGSLGDYASSFKAVFTEYDKLASLLKTDANTETLLAQLQTIQKICEDEDITFLMEDTDQLITESKEGLVRVKEIVQNLKSFVRLDEGAVETANMNECLESTLKVVWNELKYNCEVEKDFGDIPEIICNAGQLNQVFANLMVNAGHAIEERGKITLHTHATDTHVVIQVTDTGKGIAPENLARLFDPFFTTKPVGQGTGLGLSVSHGIIQKHGGHITVASEVGNGSTFTITLPINGKTEEELDDDQANNPLR